MGILTFIVPRVKDGSDNNKLIRACNLILIFCFGLTACFNTNKEKELKLQWKENQVTGLAFSRIFFPESPEDSIKNLLTVHLFTGENPPPVIGQFRLTINQIVFEPLIPLTRGLTYEVRFRNQPWSKIQVPPAYPDLPPEVLNVFPTQDSLPENFLKIYIGFSTPMQEDQALRYLLLIRNKTDTVESAFLPLQQELWNKDRTILTVWLHPGRIKRDLQPNKKMGAPLHEGDSYQLIISKECEDIHGVQLKQSYIKNIKVVSRDSLSPTPETWQVKSPAAGTRNALELKFNESLVYTLIQESIEINNPEKKTIEGELKIMAKETGVSFIPTFVWKRGWYTILISSRLEDLAGNNLSRPFDNDFAVNRNDRHPDVFEIRFEVK